MTTGRIAAATILTICLGGIAHGASEQTACPNGELTNQRLASEFCMDRIPVPMARPGQDVVEASAEPVQPVEVEYIETPGLNEGEVRTVRLVGPRFLPEIDEQSQIHQAMTEAPDSGWGRVVYSAASWLGVTTAHASHDNGDNAETAEAHEQDEQSVEMAGSSSDLAVAN